MEFIPPLKSSNPFPFLTLHVKLFYSYLVVCSKWGNFFVQFHQPRVCCFKAAPNHLLISQVCSEITFVHPDGICHHQDDEPLDLEQPNIAKSNAFEMRGGKWKRCLNCVLANCRMSKRARRMRLQFIDETTRQETLLPLLSDSEIIYILLKGGSARL
jgi:hypothetical protein